MRVSENTFKVVLLALLLGLALRALLPSALQIYVNRTLDRAENYNGHIGDVDLHLIQGAYVIEDVVLVKSNGQVDTPLFKAERINFSLLWSALFDGALVGEAALYAPTINIVDSKDEQSTQSGKGEAWLDIAGDLFPLRIDRLQISGGSLHFLNNDAQAQVDIYADNINALATNIVNSRDLARELEAKVELSGNTKGDGSVSMNGAFDPTSALPSFDIDFEAQNIALQEFDALLDYYAPFDLEAGSLNLAIELASDRGELRGYLKPVLKGVEVFSWKGDVEEDEDGPLASLRELLAGGLLEIFENQAKDQFASDIRLSGKLDTPDVDSLNAFLAILRNAFIDAIQAKVDHTITLGSDARERAAE